VHPTFHPAKCPTTQRRPPCEAQCLRDRASGAGRGGAQVGAPSLPAETRAARGPELSRRNRPRFSLLGHDFFAVGVDAGVWISTLFGDCPGLFLTVTVSTPSFSSADTFDMSTPSGSVNVRLNSPNERS